MSIHPDDLRQQFDNGIEVGKAQERERIIKLLEATSDLTSIECGQLVNYADTAIELIKGEQK